MNKDKFEDQMENLPVPNINDVRHQQILKFALLNSKKSSRIGLAFIIIPCLFLFGQFIKEWMNIDLGFFSTFENFMSQLDKIPLLKWIFPLILVVLPIITIIINSLSILHFYRDRINKELLITIKFRLLNLILIFISLCIVAIMLYYVAYDNIYEHIIRTLDL